MTPEIYDTTAAWRVDDLAQDTSWLFPIAEKDSAQLARAAQRAYDPDRPLLDYQRDDFDLGNAMTTIAAAARQAYFGHGLALITGLPRGDLSAAEFKLLTWAIGLHLGVARPQGKATHYLSEVCAAGMNYRSAGGRGYNSNAALDFHADSCDLVALACYNAAKAGGQSMVSSSVTAWQILSAERPDLAEIACQDFYFSRNQEQAPDEGPYYAQPLFDFKDGRLFAKWNRNRVRTAQDIDGVPKLTDAQRECTDLLDEILRRPEVMFTMWLKPGDMQLMNNHVQLHSRTTFEDFDEPERKRMLYRLWMATPDSVALPESWKPYYRSVAPGTVRGGILGHHHDEICHAFECRQARLLGMPEPMPPAGVSAVA